MKEKLREAFNAGKKYWQTVETDEPLMYHPIDFEEWFATLPVEDETQLNASTLKEMDQAVGFAEWIVNQQFKMYNYKWVSTKIFFSGCEYTTTELYNGPYQDYLKNK